MTTAEQLAEIVEPVVAASGHTLYDVELTGATVRVLVAGAGLEDLARLSPQVSVALDEAEVGPGDGRWFLEVSSPGLERPLRRPDHYLAAVGERVKVKTKPGVDGERRVDGTIEAADESGVVVAGRRLSYDEIERARTVFEWGAAPEPALAKKPSPQTRKVTR